MANVNVGTHIEAMKRRAAAHMSLATRKLTVRIHVEDEGLKIWAYFAARNGGELEAQHAPEVGRRLVPWVELDDRAGELVRLVDECVAEVERSLGEVAIV